MCIIHTYISSDMFKFLEKITRTLVIYLRISKIIHFSGLHIPRSKYPMLLEWKFTKIPFFVFLSINIYIDIYHKMCAYTYILLCLNFWNKSPAWKKPGDYVLYSTCRVFGAFLFKSGCNTYLYAACIYWLRYVGHWNAIYYYMRVYCYNKIIYFECVQLDTEENDDFSDFWVNTLTADGWALVKCVKELCIETLQCIVGILCV